MHQTIPRSALALLALGLLAATRISESDLDAIAAAVQHVLHVSDFTTSAFQEKNFAIAFWPPGDGYAPGQALLKKAANGDWTVLKMTTGSLKDVSVLESLGVPAAQARAFVADLAKATPP